jgi:hypothetical protein
MDELGEILEQILKWAKTAAIVGMVVLGFLVYDRWGETAIAVAGSDESQRTDAEPPPNAAHTDVSDVTPEEAPNRQPQQRVIEQADDAPAASAAQSPSLSPEAGSQPAPTIQAALVVYTENACAGEPQNDVPLHRKHRWPRRFFGAIGHGFKAIGRGLGKVGKAVVGR